MKRLGSTKESENPFSNDDIELVLLGRDKTGLEESQKYVEIKCEISLFTFDLGNLDTLEKETKKLFNEVRYFFYYISVFTILMYLNR